MAASADVPTDAPKSDDGESLDVLGRLRLLEEHRNALQIAWIALAQEMLENQPNDVARTRLTMSLRYLAADMDARVAVAGAEPHGAAVLRTLARLVEDGPDRVAGPGGSPKRVENPELGEEPVQ